MIAYRALLRALGRTWVGSPVLSGAHSLEAALAAVQAADVIEREPDDNGPRVAVIAPGLGGAFYFDVDEARRRIASHFPSLSHSDARRVVNSLRARVKLATQPTPAPRRRGGFVHAWRDQRNLECFEQ